MKLSFQEDQTISDFQSFTDQVYGEIDDRSYSLSDLLANAETFTMRALKGIRKTDRNKIKINLIIAYSWVNAIANRLHIDLEKAIWKRFPYLCSYCGKKPCICKKIKIKKRVEIKRLSTLKPQTLSGIQQMFNEIYPAENRSIIDAGIHLAEETGEISEAILTYIGEHKKKQFAAIKDELADWVSCFFGVASSANINLARELSKKFDNNCHVCRRAPCICDFSFVSQYRS